MKKFIVAIALISLAGCMKPYDVPEFVEIGPNETAFVVPLTGANQDSQGQFDSADYLNERKVATKRIQIPHEWVQKGRMSNDGEWVPTMRVLRVDRQPV